MVTPASERLAYSCPGRPAGGPASACAIQTNGGANAPPAAFLVPSFVTN